MTTWTIQPSHCKDTKDWDSPFQLKAPWAWQAREIYYSRRWKFNNVGAVERLKMLSILQLYSFRSIRPSSFKKRWTICMYGVLTSSCLLQYIIMRCMLLMENQWRDKPVTFESTQTQFTHWHVEGVCDWFWLLEGFNIVFRALIDSHSPYSTLSIKAQHLAKA